MWTDKKLRLANLAAPMTWLLVAVVPVIFGLTIRFVFPSQSLLFAWLGAGFVFTICGLLAEPLWRSLQYVFNGFKPEMAYSEPETPEHQAANIVVAVLTQENASYSKLMKGWPAITQIVW